MSTNPAISARYPKQVQLDESFGAPGPSFFRIRPGGQPQLRPVSLRLMSASDKDSILLFARSLPKEQLLYLRHDITDPASVDEWISSIEHGTTITILAEPSGTLEGYASLHLSPVRWTSKVGEIALNIAPEWQSRGLGEALCGEIVDLAAMLGLRKLAAQMLAEHKSARALFARLGFRIQAFLPDWIEDPESRSRDLLLMARDISRETEPAQASA